ncbi:hypothetical protein P8452_35664 [Trifolium repens]|nr:hypothetical protein P8452_35664 [Trifolium repens]
MARYIIKRESSNKTDQPKMYDVFLSFRGKDTRAKTRGLVVVPVFYEVDPSEVRHQEGQFGKSFEDLISTISVDETTKCNWRRDLLDIGGKTGFSLIDSRNENADIKNIVEHLTPLLHRTELFVAEHPVGVESRVEAAIK